jgi:hypothetical protein
MCADSRDLDFAAEETVRISLLVDKSLVKGIERASALYGLTKSEFIRQACVRALGELEKEPDWDRLVESTRGLFYYDLAVLKKRLQQTGYVSPEGWAVIQKKITDKKGPVEQAMNLPSPYYQLLHLLGLNPKTVEADIKNDRITKLKGGE